MQIEPSYNKRQLGLMISTIEDYFESKLTFYHLVGNLFALLDLLEGMSLQVKENILEQINHLEEYRAFMVIDNKLTLDDVEKIEVDDILRKLKFQLNNLYNQYSVS